ncbi:MAG: UDP-N-acetylmuramate dehydrogenase [Candidatus Omnitrophica bacterium]|nr:UDP-N-acetylmuramate dehydrogenase [Candidatus Omnitrophota bacterium]
MSLKQTKLKRNYSLADFTTIKIGGEARYFFTAESAEALKKVLKKFQGAFYILGGGSNLLVADNPIEKCIIKLGEEFSYIRKDKYLEVGSRTPLSHLIKYVSANNLGGFDNLAGIPATVGGLVMMNASSFGREISEYLKEVEVMDNSGNVKILKKDGISFSYRKSSLNDYVILRVWFEAVKDYDVKAKISNFLKTRMSRQDFEFPNCGCIFKNPIEKPAGFLIEACGLKGLKKNDAQISPKHANFIINLKKARYNDVDYLTSYIKESVHKKFGIVLEEEIKRWA